MKSTNSIWIRYRLRLIWIDIRFLNFRALPHDVAELLNPKYYTWRNHV